MGTWQRIRAALRRERRDVEEALEEWTAEGNAALDRREREQRASPEERLAMEEERAAELDADFETIRRRIEGGG